MRWPSKMTIGTDGQGQSFEHIRVDIMGDSMESLIHHFKLVTEGFSVPAGRAVPAGSSTQRERSAFTSSRPAAPAPYRAHFRDPGYSNLQTLGMMCEGGMLSDVIIALASDRPGDGRS